MKRVPLEGKMKKVVILLFFGFILLSTPDLLADVWAKAYGGSTFEGVRSLCRTNDGSYLLTGETHSFGSSNYDFLVVKLKPSGDTAWNLRIGSQMYDGARGIYPTRDGGFVLVGRTYLSGRNNEFAVIKIDGDGDISFAKTYGTTAWDEAFAVSPTSDGGYIVAGKTFWHSAGDYEILVIKLAPNGDVVWAKSYGSRYEDYARGAFETSDGCYIVAGSTWGPAGVSLDLLFIKLNSQGDIVWVKQFAPGGIGSSELRSVSPTPDGGCIAVGRRIVLGGGNDFLVIKLTADGELEWARIYGGDDYDAGTGGYPTSDGGYIVAGSTASFGDSSEFLVIKLNADGSISWAGAFGSQRNDSAYCVCQTIEGNYIVAGHTNSWGVADYDFLAIEVDSTGSMRGCPYWRTVYLNTSSPNIPTGTQTLTVAEPPIGVSAPAFTFASAPVVITHIWPLTAITERNIIRKPTTISFGRRTNLLREGKIMLYDIRGNKIRTSQEGVLNLDLPSGIYFYQSNTAKGMERKKFILIR